MNSWPGCLEAKEGDKKRKRYQIEKSREKIDGHKKEEWECGTGKGEGREVDRGDKK